MSTVVTFPMAPTVKHYPDGTITIYSPRYRLWMAKRMLPDGTDGLGQGATEAEAIAELNEQFEGDAA